MGHHCCSKQKVKRGLWSPEEDEKLVKCINTHGHGCWSSVPKLAGLQRCGKSCRLRWINYLRPDLKRGSFSAQEERIIIDVHRILGNKWAQIAKHLPGRTDNEVKNFWNSCIKKKLIAQGLDPTTHNLIPYQTNNNSIINNACKPNQIYQQPTSAFSINSQMRSDSSMITIMPHDPYNPSATNPSPLHEAITNIPTSDCQNPNLVWTAKDLQNTQVMIDFSSRSSMESTSIITSINPSGFGALDDQNCFWAGSVDDQCFEIFPRHEETLKQQQQQMGEVEFVGLMNEEKINSSISDHQGMEEASLNNFDLDFMDSTLMPCEMYSSTNTINSIDQLAWDC